MESQTNYDVIVVGSGAAGLTSAAYLCKYGYHVLLCEKEVNTGGLICSFKHDGFYFDSGIRAFENSGIIFPMLKQLNIDVEFVKNIVSIGINNKIVTLNSKESLIEYEGFLTEIFPQNKKDIHNIINEISKVMHYMDVLYGIDNPLFLDFNENQAYIFKTLLPWLFKYQININKAMNLNENVDDYLLHFTNNQALIDMITQHFFKNTPTFFALSYFGLYLDYSYPIGGTTVLVRKLTDYIIDHQGVILNKTEVCAIDTNRCSLKTSNGKEFKYRKIVWAGDSQKLYKIIGNCENNQQILQQKKLVDKNRGGDSIISLYLGINIDKKYFSDKCGAHMFYTAKNDGLSSKLLNNWDKFNCSNLLTKNDIKELVAEYFELTTYEISCPVIRDKSLAPSGQTGLIISTLIDFEFVKAIKISGWYDEFKEFCSEQIISVLESSIFPVMKDNIIFSICSTPLTIERMTGNRDGAITGWAFNEGNMPSEVRFKKIAKSVLTPIPNIYQAGQWTFSPSGVPISILTGKLSADEVDKALGRKSRKKSR